jgi:predicted GTPase
MRQHGGQVLFVGTTGHGKSTSLNVVFNEGNPDWVRFKEGGSMSPTTKAVDRAEMVYDGKSLVLVDTPGLHDKDDERLQAAVLEAAGSEAGGACVVLCIMCASCIRQ